MKWRKIIVIVLSVFIGLIVIIKVATLAFVEPWLEKKIETTLQEKLQDYTIEIDNVNVAFLSWGIELKTIRITSKVAVPAKNELKLEIASVKFKRIDFYKLISTSDIKIEEILISRGRLQGEMPEEKKEPKPVISNANIEIGKIVFHQLEFDVKNFSSPQIFSAKEGTINLHHVKFNKKDTVSLANIKEFDLKVEEFSTILPDSLYTLKAGGIVYDAKDNRLTLEDFIVHANYPDYVFAARQKYQSDCVRAIVKNISFNDFSVEDFIKENKLVSTYVEVEEMDIHVFRDKRKEFHHTVKPMVQDLIYDYKGKLRIDSVGLINGNVTYVEHVEQAVHPGKISFTGINAKVYNIDNDTIYKTTEKFLEIKGYTYLMGKGKVTIALKGKLYDPHNAVLISGSLSTMDASVVNPMLEKNAFIYVTAGKVQSINFTFRADKYKANGKMIMLYEGLDVAVKDKKTNDTTALKAKVISLVANKMIRDSNPEKGDETREGIIEYERDPERFLFNYCFKSILSGLKSSLSKPHKEKEKRNKRSKEVKK